MATLERAIQIAVQAHAGQVDKSDQPYILHPLRVMRQFSNSQRNEQIVAVLHDVIEDSDWTIEAIKAEQFSDEVCDALQAMTKTKQDDYEEDYITRIAENRLATKVKIADLQDNLTVTRLQQLTEVDVQRVNKYLRSLRRLQTVLTNQ